MEKNTMDSQKILKVKRTSISDPFTNINPFRKIMKGEYRQISLTDLHEQKYTCVKEKKDEIQ